MPPFRGTKQDALQWVAACSAFPERDRMRLVHGLSAWPDHLVLTVMIGTPVQRNSVLRNLLDRDYESKQSRQVLAKLQQHQIAQRATLLQQRKAAAFRVRRGPYQSTKAMKKLATLAEVEEGEQA